MKVIWRDYKTPPNRQENICVMYFRQTHFWHSTNRLRINLGTTRLTLSMDCPNLHKHNYENHCMNMQLELQKLMHKLRLEDSNQN